MDLREIKKLINLMNENGLNRLEVEEEGKRYLLEKGNHQIGVERAIVGLVAHPTAELQAPAAVPREAPPVEDTVTFNSPMVGTFYRAASPDAEPYVTPGDHVSPESAVCIIEAMKVFNEVRAEMSGTIVEVLAENSEAVEYNQPLFLIKPD